MVTLSPEGAETWARVRPIIDAAVADCRKRGIPVGPGLWGLAAYSGHFTRDSQKRVCPLGATLFGQPVEWPIAATAAARLQVSVSWVHGFIAAYDQHGFHGDEQVYPGFLPEYKNGFICGQQYRAESGGDDAGTHDTNKAE